MKVNYENIPQTLKEMPNWVVWKAEQRDGRITKVPYDALTNHRAESNNRSTWSPFETAVHTLENSNYDGLGIMLSDGLVGVDLDDVEEEIKEYQAGGYNIVTDFVERLQSYAEISPSGTGIHIIVRGTLPPTGRRRGNVEMYNTARYFTVTGNTFSEYTEVTDDTDYNALGYLHGKYIRTEETAPAVQPTNELSPTHDLSNDEVLEVAYNSKVGMRVKMLHEGGWEQFYASQSEAELAYMSDLAFFTAKNPYQMDELYRSSSLYREKWDEQRGEETYGVMTINKAIATCRDVYKPKRQDDFKVILNQRKEEKWYSYDDTGNAERFADQHGDVLRYSHVRRKWYYYDGKVWNLDQQGATKVFADRTIQAMREEKPYVTDDMSAEEAEKLLRKHIKSTRSSSRKESMIKEAQHLLPVDIEEFDKHEFLFNFQNGYLDLSTSVLHPHDREKYFTRISNVSYTGERHSQLWLDFLNDIFNNDAELIEYIQRAIGYSLSGSTEEQKLFILYGNGRNGKSVFLDAINHVMGEYSANIRPESIMVRHNQGNANPDIAKLDGARFVTTTESDDGMRLNEGLVKQLTGGDRVSARFLYEDEFEFTPQFKLWMATNYKPIIRGTDDGIWRRISIIPFTVRIPEEKVDKRLTEKLKKEAEAIAHWCAEGFMKWQKYGLDEPAVVRAQVNEYRREMDALEVFIEECCIIQHGVESRSSELYAVYKAWAERNNQYVMSSTKFGREMGKKFETRKSGTTIYQNITVKVHNNDTFTVNY